MRGLFFLLSAFACLFFPELSAHAQGEEHLFLIERSKNANVVQYDVKVEKDGSLNEKDPVVGYWVMKAEDSRREDLTWQEKKIAYGFEVKPNGASKEPTMTLVAYKDRPLKLTRVGGKWRAQVTIAGKQAYLQKLFVQTKEGLLPQVLWVDLYGEEIGTGKALQERINKS